MQRDNDELYLRLKQEIKEEPELQVVDIKQEPAIDIDYTDIVATSINNLEDIIRFEFKEELSDLPDDQEAQVEYIEGNEFTNIEFNDAESFEAESRDGESHEAESRDAESRDTESLEAASISESDVTKVVDDKQVRSFDCKLCERKFPTPWFYETHMKLHLADKPYDCRKCGKSFYNLVNLTTHQKFHCELQPFDCSYCQQTFKTASNLKQHVASQHFSTGAYNCPKCDKRFRNQKNLKYHMRHHNNSYTDCKICDKKFTQSYSLTVHMRTHTGEKPYKCDVCEKTFSQAASLYYHKRIHTGEKPHACKHCDLKFAQIGHLGSHMKKHKLAQLKASSGEMIDFEKLIMPTITLTTDIRENRQQEQSVDVANDQNNKGPKMRTRLRDKISKTTEKVLSILSNSDTTKNVVVQAQSATATETLPPIEKATADKATNKQILRSSVQIRTAVLEAIELAKKSKPVETVEVQVKKEKDVENAEAVENVENAENQLKNGMIVMPEFEFQKENLLPSERTDLDEEMGGLSESEAYEILELDDNIEDEEIDENEVAQAEDVTTPQASVNNDHGNEDDDDDDDSASAKASDKHYDNDADDSSSSFDESEFFDKIVMYKCKVCGKSLKNPYSLKTHVQMHLQKCNICDKAFTKPADLSYHMRLHIKDTTIDPNKQPPLLSIEIMPPIENRKYPYKCKICKKTLTKASSLKIHMRKHTGERPHKCEFCDKTFTQSATLYYHKRTHTGEKPHKCTLCDKSYTQVSGLNHHMNSHLKPTKLVEVTDDTTLEEFEIPSLIKEEMMDAHPEDVEDMEYDSKQENDEMTDLMKDFLQDSEDLKPENEDLQPDKEDLENDDEEIESPEFCLDEVCIKKHTNGKLNKVLYPNYVKCLKRHVRDMTGKQHFKCEICDNSFSTSNYLKSHYRIHTGEQPYQCTLCNKKFTHASGLKTHSRKHESGRSYQCDICQKFFSYSTGLRGHMRMHAGVRPYKCSLCPKSFTYSGGLQSHFRCHTGEKPYGCEICGKKFSQATSLRTHRNVHKK